MSPTQRTLALMRSEGYLATVVERRNPGAFITHDLFGFIDVVAIRDGETVAVQTTSASNMASRRTKIANHENVAVVRAAGWRIELHGWRKNAAGRWVCNREDLS